MHFPGSEFLATVTVTAPLASMLLVRLQESPSPILLPPAALAGVMPAMAVSSTAGAISNVTLARGSASNNITSLSFDLTRSGLAFTGVNDIIEDNAGGNYFAAHICRRNAEDTNCAATGFATTGGGPGGAGTATGVPEPSTFMLLGAGLLIVGRQIRSKKE